MKRTIELDEKLIEEATKAAVAHGSTLTALLEDAVREKLADMKLDDSAETSKVAAPARHRVELPVFHGDGLQPGVSIESWADLVDLMDREDGPPGR